MRPHIKLLCKIFAGCILVPLTRKETGWRQQRLQKLLFFLELSSASHIISRPPSPSQNWIDSNFCTCIGELSGSVSIWANDKILWFQCLGLLLRAVGDNPSESEVQVALFLLLGKFSTQVEFRTWWLRWMVWAHLFDHNIIW